MEITASCWEFFVTKILITTAFSGGTEILRIFLTSDSCTLVYKCELGPSFGQCLHHIVGLDHLTYSYLGCWTILQ
jgi:hypothetical protein